MTKRGTFGLGVAAGIVGLVVAIKAIPVLLIAGGLTLAAKEMISKENKSPCNNGNQTK